MNWKEAPCIPFRFCLFARFRPCRPASATSSVFDRRPMVGRSAREGQWEGRDADAGQSNCISCRAHPFSPPLGGLDAPRTCDYITPRQPAARKLPPPLRCLYWETTCSQRLVVLGIRRCEVSPRRSDNSIYFTRDFLATRRPVGSQVSFHRLYIPSLSIGFHSWSTGSWWRPRSCRLCDSCVSFPWPCPAASSPSTQYRHSNPSDPTSAWPGAAPAHPTGT